MCGRATRKSSALKKYISLFGSDDRQQPSGNSRTYSWYFQCILYNILLFVSQIYSHLQVGSLPVLSYANNHQYFLVTRRGVTGRPFRLPRLELNPLRSHQLSNTKPPWGSVIDPTDPLVAVRGEKKKGSSELQAHGCLLTCLQRVRKVN